MYRRNFIKATSVTIMGLTANKVLAAGAALQSRVKVFTGKTIGDPNTLVKSKLVLSINMDAIETLSKASEMDKQVRISYIELDSTGHETSKKYVGKYEISSSKNTSPESDKNQKTFSIVLVKKSVEQNDCSLPSAVNFDKIKLLFTSKLPGPVYTVDILQKNDNVFVALRTVDDSNEGCFLTTACVATMNKPDDCYELTALRHFRDNHLLANKEGIILVKEYYNIAPAIVSRINQQTNAKEVYADIYHKMILPTIEEINNNNPLRAISIYRDYTYKLKQEFGD